MKDVFESRRFTINSKSIRGFSNVGALERRRKRKRPGRFVVGSMIQSRCLRGKWKTDGMDRGISSFSSCSFVRQFSPVRAERHFRRSNIDNNVARAFVAFPVTLFAVAGRFIELGFLYAGPRGAKLTYTKIETRRACPETSTARRCFCNRSFLAKGIKR